MKKILPLVLLASGFAAAEFRPLVQVGAGLAMPSISGDDDFKDVNGWAARIGGGGAIPVNPTFDVLLTGHLAMMSVGTEAKGDEASFELTLLPRFLELEATASWNASPKAGVFGGLVMSIPMGGTYESKQTYTDYDYVNGSYQETTVSDSDDGDIDDEADPDNFTSLKIGAFHNLNEKAAVHVAYYLPSGKYLSDGIGVKIARLEAGLTFRL